MSRFRIAVLLSLLLAACQSAEPPPPETVPAASAPNLCVPYEATALEAMDPAARVRFLTERMKACRANCEAEGTCDTEIPKMAGDFYQRARAQAALGRHDEAVVDYSRSLALDPSYVPAYRGRVASLLPLERYDDALAAADAGLALSPEDPELRQLRCQVLLKMKQPAGDC